VLMQEVQPHRNNVFAYRKGFPNPKILFNSHLDTVPPYIAPSRDEHCIYGRGACDAKGQVIAQIKAAENLVQAGIEDIGLLFVVSEETDHVGMIKANELKLTPDFVIVGEPTESVLIIRQKGALKITVECHGKAAHSGYPEKGESAIDKLLDVLQDLKKENWPVDPDAGLTTMNIGQISGGVAFNIVPAYARADIAFRLITAPEIVYNRVLQIVNGRANVRKDLANGPIHLHTVQDDDFPIGVVAFNTDIAYFNLAGKAVLFGSGTILDAHTEHEKIGIAQLEDCIVKYTKLARILLGKN